MNNNINGNYNMNQHMYTNVDEQYHLTMTRQIAERRAHIVYQYELQQAKERAEAQAQSDLVSWAETRD
jgi:hypothetical protein